GRLRTGTQRGVGLAHAGDLAGRREAWCLPAAARATEADESTEGGAEDGPTLEKATGAVKGQPPNKRLKLAGALVLNEAVVSCPGGYGAFVHFSCAGGRVARSLSAIR